MCTARENSGIFSTRKKVGSASKGYVMQPVTEGKTFSAKNFPRLGTYNEGEMLYNKI